MRKVKIEEGKQCPKFGKKENQVKKRYDRSGTQRCKCKECGIYYTINPKKREYSEETRKLAIKMYYSGISGHSVGNVLEMNRSNTMNWIKKANEERGRSVSVGSSSVVELDELYWFLERNPLQAVLAVFVAAYKRFGMEKHRYRLLHLAAPHPFSFVDFLYLRVWTLPIKIPS